MNIASVEIGADRPCRFVAEVSGNHNGSLDRALKLIDAAKEAGADFVKFQCFLPEELVALRGDGPAPEPWGSQGWTMRTLYEKAQTPLEWFPKLFEYARWHGIVPFSSVFGAESLAVLEAVRCPAYKIASLDHRHAELIQEANATGKPLLVSQPKMRATGTTAGYLYCPPGYPTTTQAVVLPIFGEQVAGEEWDCEYTASGFLGLSSHCLAPELPVAAVARGCQLIEMHLMLAEEPSDLEENVSLNQYQFAAMIQSVRATEAMLE